MVQPALRRGQRPGARFTMPPPVALWCLWSKLADRLELRGFSTLHPDAHHDVDVVDRFDPMDVWVRGGPGPESPDQAAGDDGDQVWLWGTGLIELSVGGHHCNLAYVDDRRAAWAFSPAATIVADTVADFIRRCDEAG